MTGGTLKLATRGSPLALAQAALVERALGAAHPGLSVERVVVRTTGDRQSAAGGPASGAPAAGRGVFVKEIQEALLAGQADVAVHSLKDLPVEPVAGLALGAVLSREDVRDAFCSREGRTLDELAPGARVGTGSPRRIVQLRRAWPHLEYVPVGGNVGTRLERMREGRLDGVVLARAGLVRLGLESAVTQLIPAEVCLPAPGQGAIGCEVRAGDAGPLAVLAPLDDGETRAAVEAERAFLLALGGGCRTPIAAWGRPCGDGTMSLHGFVGSAAGLRFAASSMTGPASAAAELGIRLAQRLIAEGAAELLTE